MEKKEVRRGPNLWGKNNLGTWYYRGLRILKTTLIFEDIVVVAQFNVYLSKNFVERGG